MTNSTTRVAGLLPISLDNAATSFPKPERVYAIVDRWMRNVGAAYGRGQSGAAEESRRIVDDCRMELSGLLGLDDTSHVVFTHNCTDSLNLLLNGLLQSRDRIVTTKLEHNSVLRPLTQLQKEREITFDLASFDPVTGQIDVDEFQQLLRREPTRLVVLNHASNVTGVVQPARVLIELAHRHGALVLLDAAQTAGHIPFDNRLLNADFVASAGHKGLLGPLGTGILWMRPGLDSLIHPVRCGGTGTNSESLAQPNTLPAKFESGNLNVPGIAGLLEGVRWLAEHTVESVHSHVMKLTRHLRSRLREIPSVQMYPNRWSPAGEGSGFAIVDSTETATTETATTETATTETATTETRHADTDEVGIVSFRIDGLDCRDVAMILDQSFQISCRSGLHCAPLVHEVLGTDRFGGTVRVSPGPFTTVDEITRVVDAIRAIAESV